MNNYLCIYSLLFLSFFSITYGMQKEKNHSIRPLSVQEAKNLQLLIAACNGEVATVKALLHAGADINTKSPQNGMTPLIMAIDNQKIEVVRILLEAKAPVYEETRDNGSALIYAVTRGNEALVRLVLKYFNFKNQKACTQRDNALTIAVQKGFLKIVQLLLSLGANVTTSLHGGETCLSHASHGGYITIVKELLEKGATPLTYNILGNTPLIIASAQGHLEIVQMILKASKENINAVNKEGYTALHLAIQGKYSKVVTALVEAGANVTANYPKHGLLLNFAVPYEDEETICTLVEHGAPFDIYTFGLFFFKLQKSSAFKLALTRNLIKGNKKELLLHFPFITEAHDDNGKTPLMMAICANSLDILIPILNLMASCKADINEHDNNGHTALFHALSKKIPQDLIALLLEQGARVNIPHTQEKAIFSSVIRNGYLTFMDKKNAFKDTHYGSLIEDLKRVQPTLDFNACAHCKATSQPLLLCDRCHIFKYCSSECQKKEWKSHKAVCAKKFLIDTITLQHALNTPCDDKGTTPLMLAVMHRYTKYIQELLALGADKTAQNTLGKTALDLAYELNLPEIAKLLKNTQALSEKTTTE